MVWAIAKYMVRSLFLAGHSTVILDATNTTRKRRDEWRGERWDVAVKVIPTDAETCIRRAQSIEDEVIVPIIEKMAAQFEPLYVDETEWSS